VNEEIIFISSCNFTRKGLEKNYEIGVIIFIRDEQSEFFSSFSDRFDRIFKQYNPYLVIVDEKTNKLDVA